MTQALLTDAAPLLVRTPEEIRAEIRRALEARRDAVDEGDADEVRRIDVHVATYYWLLGDTDVAPYTGRRVPVLTTSDLAFEQSMGRDHAEQKTPTATTTRFASSRRPSSTPSAGRVASSTTRRRATEPRASSGRSFGPSMRW